MDEIVHGEAEDRDSLWVMTQISGQLKDVPFAEGLGIFVPVDPISEEMLARARKKAEKQMREEYEAELKERKLKEAKYNPATSKVNYEKGVLVMSEYRDFGAMFLLDRAISYHRNAVDTTSESDTNYIKCLRELAKALESRYSATEDPEDIEEAI